MNISDRIRKSKIKGKKDRADFFKKLDELDSFGLKEPDRLTFPTDVNLSSVIMPNIRYFVNRWTTYSTGNQCEEKFMRSSLYPQFRTLFFHAWGVVRLFVPDNKKIRANAAATIAHDLKLILEDCNVRAGSKK